MHGSKFIDALLKLSTREKTKFREIAYSPYFNKNKKVRALIDTCLKYGPDFTSPSLEKKAIYKKVFGASSSSYEELKLNNVISDALRLFYLFLAQQKFASREQYWKTYQLESLFELRMSRHLPAVERRLMDLQEKRSDRSHDYYYDQYYLEERIDKTTLLREGREYNPHLQAANDALDRFYWCNKLRIACDMASRNKIINAAYQCYFIEELLQLYHLQPSVLIEQPVIQLYYQALRMLHTEEEAHYLALRTLLDQYSQNVPEEERFDLYDYAQNYCVKKINSGHTEYYAQILDLYKEMLSREVLLRSGYLTQWSYINILTAGLRLPDFEWTEWFIHTYKEQLQPDVRNNVFTYSLAALYFEQRKYHKALQSLQGVSFSDIFYHMSAKIIQIKSYYELEETEAFLSLMEASKKFLRRNRQLSDYQVLSNTTFLKLAGKLHKLRMRAPTLSKEKVRNNLQQIQHELSISKVVTNKGWLKQKIADLKMS